MKMKLFLGKVVVPMNSISEIEISKKRYYKEMYNGALQIQDFYRFIRTNKLNITFIKSITKGGITEYYLKDGVLHNLDSAALITNRSIFPSSTFNGYYINGKYKTEREWEESPERKQRLREEKLKRIL